MGGSLEIQISSLSLHHQTNKQNNQAMNISLKHTVDARAEVFTPCQFSGSFNSDRARRFNLARMAQDFDLTPKQIGRLSTIVMISEGKGDSWTAVFESNLGNVYNPSSWLAVDDTIIALMERVLERV